MDTELEPCQEHLQPYRMVFVTEKSLNAAFEKLDDRKLGYITHEDFLTGKLMKISHEKFLSSFSMQT